MVLGFIKRGVKEMMIARPDEAKQSIIYKHPDETVPMYSQLTVDADEVGVFFRDGQVVGTLRAGRHTLDSSNIPFLGGLIDSFSLMDLALFVEDTFGVRIEDTELNAETFDTLTQLSALIDSRK